MAGALSYEDTRTQIRDALQKLVKKLDDPYSIVCEVDNVKLEENICRCLPIDGRAPLEKVRLTPETETVYTGILKVPTVGSIVVVSFINKQSPFLSMTSEVENMIIKSIEDIYLAGKNTKLEGKESLEVVTNNLALTGYNEVKIKSEDAVEIDADAGIQLNGTDNKGMVKIDPLIQKLNKLENELQNLKTAIVTSPVAPMDGGLTFKTALVSSWLPVPITPTVITDLENPKVKH